MVFKQFVFYFIAPECNSTPFLEIYRITFERKKKNYNMKIPQNCFW